MFNKLRFSVFLFIVFNLYSLLSTGNTQLQCKDEENRPVDWFFIYKLPKISQTSNPLIREGVAYEYITSKGVNDGWKLSERSIGSETSIPGYTLAPLYKRNDSILWTLYNDRAPNKNASGIYGHTKGAVMADARQGFWLVHSVPGYPPAPKYGVDPPARGRSERSTRKLISGGRYSYPTSGRLYGQSFLCITVDKDQFDLIGTQLMYNQIIPYKNNLPQIIAERYPILTKAASKVRVKNSPYNHRASINSLGGTEFLSFAKSYEWQKDLYHEFVAPQLRLDILVETWPQGPIRLPSDCRGSKVMNIKSVEFANANVEFEATKDHSKWVVSKSGNDTYSWVCVGDINRATGQFSRGGGTVCLNSKPIWTSYRNIVKEVESCPPKKPRDSLIRYETRLNVNG